MGITGKASPSLTIPGRIKSTTQAFGSVIPIEFFINWNILLNLNDHNFHRRCKNLTFVLKYINHN